MAGILGLALWLIGGVGPAAAPSACASEVPEPLWGSVWVYHPPTDEILLFGGARAARDFTAGTWTWTEEGWSCRDVAGPPARGFAGAAFDPESGLIVIHGGRGVGNVTLGDTWGWDGRSWRRLAGAGPSLDHHEIVWSGVDAALFAFGGWDGARVKGESWRWSGASWERIEVDGPPPRSAFAMAYDAARERVVVHGGLWVEGQYADAWEWDGSAWIARWPPYANSSMDHHAMVFDRARRRLIVFGGKNYRYRPLHRTLALGDAGFEQLSSEGPTARHSVGLTYDPTRGRAVLFGGKFYRNGEQVPLGDLWLFDGSEWRPWAAAAMPPGGGAAGARRR